MPLYSRIAAAALIVALARAPLPAHAPQTATPSSTTDHALGLSGAPNFRDFGGALALLTLLLEALHLPRATILVDYAMTEKLTPSPPPHPPMGDPAPAMPPAVAQVPQRADPAYAEASLRAVQRHYGSIDAYMRGALHMTPVEIASLRHNLLS